MKLLFENEFFRSERADDGSTVITIVKDGFRFEGVDLTGCKIITNAKGFCDDELTEGAKKEIKHQSEIIKIKEEVLWYKKRNRMLTALMSML